MYLPHYYNFRNIKDSMNRLWRADKKTPVEYIIPHVLSTERNQFIIPTYIVLRKLRSLRAYVDTSVYLIGEQLGLEPRNKRLMQLIVEALIRLQELKLIKGINFSELKRADTFRAYIEPVESWVHENCAELRYAKIFTPDLTAYRDIPEHLYCYIVPYVNQLVRLRLLMSRTMIDSYQENFGDHLTVDQDHRYSFITLREDNLYKYRCHNSPPVLDMLNLYAELGVLAWAKFERTTPKSRERVEFIAIINDGCNNKQRLKHVIECMPHRETGEIEITYMSTEKRSPGDLYQGVSLSSH